MLVVGLFNQRSIPAGDWPQILGPQRNGVAVGETIAGTWPGQKPKKVWSKPVGTGYAGVAIANKRVVLYHRVQKNDVVELLELSSGKPFWKKTFPTYYVASITKDDGPRAVPLIHENRIYLHSAEGVVRALNLKDGSLIWERKTKKIYDAPDGYFGQGSTPVVAGKNLILNVGGDKQNAGVVALSLKDGQEVWKSVKDKAS